MPNTRTPVLAVGNDAKPDCDLSPRFDPPDLGEHGRVNWFKRLSWPRRLGVLFGTGFLLLVAFVGLNQLAYVAFSDCPSSLVLRKAFGVERGCAR